MSNCCAIEMARMRGVGLIPRPAHLSLVRFNVSFTVNNNTYRVGIVGATGAVGQELIALLQAHAFPLAELRPLASARSAGRTIEFAGRKITVQEATPDAFAGLNVAFFAAGGSVSRALAPEAVKRGCLVIDKSSAFRMDRDVPLVVPEINPQTLRTHRGVIASPNCSTAVALMALYPLHRAFGLKRVVFATYQSVSGTGAPAVAELEAQVQAYVAGRTLPRSVYPWQIFQNLIPHIDSFGADGYTGEESKMRSESRKILDLPELRVSATCIRVPVVRAHSVAINAEFARPVSVAAAREAVAGFAGAELIDDPAANAYPTPLAYTRKEKCGVGRIRLDSALDNGLALWVSGDNLWKGAALNAIQTAEKMIAMGLPLQA
jgi:aspartate-semialdehyde dehydrogenase